MMNANKWTIWNEQKAHQQQQQKTRFFSKQHIGLEQWVDRGYDDISVLNFFNGGTLKKTCQIRNHNASPQERFSEPTLRTITFSHRCRVSQFDPHLPPTLDRCIQSFEQLGEPSMIVLEHHSVGNARLVCCCVLRRAMEERYSFWFNGCIHLWYLVRYFMTFFLSFFLWKCVGF